MDRPRLFLRSLKRSFTRVFKERNKPRIVSPKNSKQSTLENSKVTKEKNNAENTRTAFEKAKQKLMHLFNKKTKKEKKLEEQERRKRLEEEKIREERRKRLQEEMYEKTGEIIYKGYGSKVKTLNSKTIAKLYSRRKSSSVVSKKPMSTLITSMR